MTSSVTKTYWQEDDKNNLFVYAVRSFCCNTLRLFNPNFNNDYKGLYLELRSDNSYFT
jgi:hypothetical protein